MDDQPDSATGAFEQALQETGQASYVLRLYISGNTTRSNQAITILRQLCEENLKGRYHLEVVDIQQQPELARGEQIVAVPTLIRKLPLPIRKVIGDLSEIERVLIGLDLVKRTH